MEQLIPIINKLQDVFATVKSQPIDLPQIAVVGSQSVGKSSVLENIVGRDFLPRGTDIVTRRPLILQLINTKSSRDIVNITSSSGSTTDYKGRSGSKDFDSDSKHLGDSSNDHSNNTNSNNYSNNSNNVDLDDSDREWGEFLHKKGVRFYDFADIRKEIEAETERVAPSKAVSPEPINLKIFSPRVLNLTLVDLPGMTKVPVANQPQDIGHRINKLIRAFISRPKCLILAVSAATSDLATSDGMQMALQIDPKGVRTLGVITKLDLMDQGTDAMDVLNGKVIPLQLGYVGVINRSQQNIYDNLNIATALKNEERFFKNHPAYRNIAHCCGIPFLAKKLNQILINHIKASLPDLKQQINNSIIELQTELMSYGEPLSAKEKNKGALLLQLISKFSDNFGSAIDGSGVMMLSRQNPASMSEASLRRPLSDKGLTSTAARDLFGGARILYIFRTEFQQNLASIKPFDGLSDNLILNNMRNASGIRSSLFIPEMCFENLVKIQIEKLRHPCVNCVEMVYEELKRIASQCQTADISRFLKFRTALNECVIEMLKRHLDPCRTFVHQLIDIELAYINTNHPDFISMDDVFTELRTNPNPRPSVVPSVQSTNEPSTNPSQSSARTTQPPTNPSNSSTTSNVSTNTTTTANTASAQNKAKPIDKKDKKPAEQGMFGLWGGGRSTNEPVVEDGKDKDKDNKDRNYHSSSELQSANPFEQASFENQNMLNAGQGMGYLNGGSQNRHTTPREQLELSVIKRFIKSYFEIVKKNVSDTVPKSIMLMLINLSKERLQQDLALTLYREEKFEELLSENPEIAQKRKQTNDLLSVLRKSLDIVNEVRDHKSITNEY